jgi:hypothetical protein
MYQEIDMEPKSASTVLSVIVKSSELIKKLLADVDNTNKDTKYYTTYLEVASIAIRGIEEEYIGILVEAANRQLENTRQKQQ